MQYIQSFRRVETKYLLTEEKAEEFIAAAGDILLPDKYGDYTICNLYLDTDDFYFIQRSLDKPTYKEKLRLRSYGNASPDDTVFLEIKKKYRGVVYKRRITLPCREAMAHLLSGEVPPSVNDDRSRQIFREIDWLMKRYEPTPKVYLAYDRKAYRSEVYPSLRVTFDRNIRSRFEDITLGNDESAELLNTGTENYRLMEIKCDEAVPLEVAKILSQLKIFPVSFSKYGNIYKAKLKGKVLTHD